MPACKLLQLVGGHRRILVRIKFTKLSNYSKERTLPKNSESAKKIVDKIMNTIKIERKKMFADLHKENQFKFKN